MPAADSLLGRVGSKLANLLTEDEKAARAARAQGSSAAHLSRTEFEDHLRTLIRGNPGSQPLAGKVNFIGLTKIREKLGDRWAHVAERAEEVTRRAIERRLTDADVYTRYKELHYLIVFAQLSKDQAQMKCALIAEEITKRLLGDDIPPEMLEVKTVVGQTGSDLAFENVPSIEELAARLSDDAADDADGKPPGPAEAEDETDAWWKAPQGGDPLDAVKLVYRPMWDVKRNAVTTYVCVPAVLGPAGRLKVGETQIGGLDDHAVIDRLDAMVQKRVISDLRKLIAANQRMLLCLPVHFETLAISGRRAAYVELCQRGIPPQAAQLIAFELTGVPAGAPPSRLIEISTALRKYGRGVLMRTTVSQAAFSPPSDTGISGVGFEHAPHAIPESRQIQDMERFAAAAKKAGLVSYVHGLPSISLATGAIGAGFDFVDGEVVTSVVDQPQTAYAFDVTKLFAAH